MYGRSFEDPDGHIWEVMWMDPAALAAAARYRVSVRLHARSKKQHMVAVTCHLCCPACQPDGQAKTDRQNCDRKFQVTKLDFCYLAPTMIFRRSESLFWLNCRRGE